MADFDQITKEEAGAYYKARRLEMGKTQTQVADEVGLPNVNYMTLYETGRHDIRKSKYFPALLAAANINVDDAREHFGVTNVFSRSTPGDAMIALPPNAQRPSGAVLIRHLGAIQAAMAPVTGKKKPPQHRLVECPLPVAKKYDPNDLFTLTVDGDSMTCTDVQRQIPSGATVLFHKYPGKLEPRAASIVAAWIPEIDQGVLKLFKEHKEGIVLESYNPQGARFPARKYPRMVIQGICLGFWVEFV